MFQKENVQDHSQEEDKVDKIKCFRRKTSKIIAQEENKVDTLMCFGRKTSKIIARKRMKWTKNVFRNKNVQNHGKQGKITDKCPCYRRKTSINIADKEENRQVFMFQKNLPIFSIEYS